MSVATYDELVTAVSDWLAREDLAPRVNDFISLAEININELLRARENLTYADVIGVSDTIAVPADCLLMETLQGPAGVLIQQPYETLAVWPQVAYSCYYAQTPDATMWYIPGSTDVTIRVWYFKKLTPLNPAQQTNELMPVRWDIYLGGALTEAEIYLKYPPDQREWAPRFVGAIKTLNDRYHASKIAGSTPRTQPAYGNTR